MSMAIVGRPVNGITINGALEFLLDDNGEVKIFDSPGQARSFLLASGVGIEALQHITIMESCGTCRRCGSPLFSSLLDGYAYQCLTCDEDFYKFEQDV